MKLVAFIIIFTCILIIRLFAFIIRSACKAVDYIDRPQTTISQNYNGYDNENFYIPYISYIRKNGYYPEKYYDTMFEVVMYFYFISITNCALDTNFNDNMKKVLIGDVLKYTQLYNVHIKGLSFEDMNLLISYFDNFDAKIKIIGKTFYSKTASIPEIYKFTKQSKKVITDFVSQFNLPDIDEAIISFTIAASLKFMNLVFQEAQTLY